MYIQQVTAKIRAFDLSNKAELGYLWQQLEQRADCSIFLSWQWISHWLTLVSQPMLLVTAYQNNNIVGLGVLVEQQRKVFGLWPIKQWYLHRTGNQQQDQIWMEYNDFLLDADIADEVRSQMVRTISAYDHSVKELIVGLSAEKVITCFKKHFTHSRELFTSPGYLIDLSAINGDYLAKVPSKNTRAQIKRSDKLLAQQGQVNFSVVTDKEQVAVLFTDIAKMHIKRWQHTEEGSGFSNELFKVFHQQLVAQSDKSTVQVAVLSVNDKALGYLVNFLYQQKVYFYLSALVSADNNKIKVGLSLHSKAIQHYLSANVKSYDFLGGEARYKQSLSNRRYPLVMHCFFNNKILLLESKLKQLKQYLAKVLNLG